MRDMRLLARSLGLTKIREDQLPLKAEESDISDCRYVNHEDGLDETVDDDLSEGRGGSR